MFYLRTSIVFVCALSLAALTGCNRNKISDDKSEELNPLETKIYIIPALDSEHQVRIEINGDEDMNVRVGVADGDKMGDVLDKAEKKKSAKFEVKIPAGKEARIEIQVEKKCLVKTSIRSM